MTVLWAIFVVSNELKSKPNRLLGLPGIRIATGQFGLGKSAAFKQYN